jgi:hypothetical protein
MKALSFPSIIAAMAFIMACIGSVGGEGEEEEEGRGRAREEVTPREGLVLTGGTMACVLSLVSHAMSLILTVLNVRLGVLMRTAAIVP